MPLGRFFGQFFGRTIGDAASFAIGGSISRTIDPVLQEVENEAWATSVAAGVSKPVDAGTLAAGVAQGQVDEGQARTWAAQQGFNGKAFDALINIANIGPGMAQAFNLWRRSQIDELGFRRALRRLGLEGEWIADLWAVRMNVLDPADLARGIHRGLVPDPGLLKGTLPSGVGNVPAYPVYPIPVLAEALAGGYDKDHLGVLVGLQGNPMGAHEAAQAEFRGVLTNDDYLRAIAEGNTRNEWADAIREQSRAILTPTQYVDGHLRGWITDAEMVAGAAKHGMIDADTELLFKIHGRPLTFHQVIIGLARGGKYDGPITMIDPTFLKSLQQSSLRPEWFNLAWFSRYTLPSAFVLRALTSDGTITGPQSEQLLLESGWRPDLAKQAASKWAAGTGQSGKDATAANLRAEYEGMFISRAQLLDGLTALGYDQHEAELLASLGDAARVKKYRDAVVTAVYKAYIGHSIPALRALSDLATVGIDADGAKSLVSVWDQELAVSVKTLTAAQIKRAFAATTLTRDEALQELEDKGYSAANAAVYLDS